MTIKNLVKQELKDKSLTYLANELGKSKQLLNYILMKEDNIKINELIEICKVLDIKVEDFITKYLR
jgi:DNA-binding Xre family transcriptional regulator